MQRRAFLAGWLALTAASACSRRQHVPRLVLIGDSTVADYPAARAPLNGWGQALRERMQNRTEVINHAVPGSSTLSFAHQHWRETVAILGDRDRLLIQFGHVDALPDPARHTEPDGQYRRLLARFVSEARAAGTRPVLITPVPRYIFVGNHVSDSHGRYAETVRELALESGVALIDLAALGTHAMEQVGEVRARRWFMLDVDGRDVVHLTVAGAAAMAALVETELVRNSLL